VSIMDWIGNYIDRMIDKKLPVSTEYVEAHAENTRRSMRSQVDALLRRVIDHEDVDTRRAMRKEDSDRDKNGG